MLIPHTGGMKHNLCLQNQALEDFSEVLQQTASIFYNCHQVALWFWADMRQTAPDMSAQFTGRHLILSRAGGFSLLSSLKIHAQRVALSHASSEIKP